MRISILLILFHMTMGIQSQTPGYLGKKIYLSAGGTLSLFNRLYAPEQTDTLKIYRNELTRNRFFPEIKLSYNMGRTMETGISLHQLKSSFLLNRIHNIETRLIEIYFRHYEKARGGLAPLGTWVQGGIALIRNQFQETPEPEQERNFYSAGLTFGIGMQRALGNRWLLDGGWELLIPPQLFMSDMKLAPGYYQGTNDYNKNLSYASLSAVRLRLGFLLY